MPNSGSSSRTALLLHSLVVAAVLVWLIMTTVEIALGGTNLPASIHNDVLCGIGFAFGGGIAGRVLLAVVDGRRPDRDAGRLAEADATGYVRGYVDGFRGRQPETQVFSLADLGPRQPLIDPEAVRIIEDIGRQLRDKPEDR